MKIGDNVIFTIEEPFKFVVIKNGKVDGFVSVSDCDPGVVVDIEVTKSGHRKYTISVHGETVRVNSSVFKRVSYAKGPEIENNEVMPGCSDDVAY